MRDEDDKIDPQPEKENPVLKAFLRKEEDNHMLPTDDPLFLVVAIGAAAIVLLAVYLAYHQ